MNALLGSKQITAASLLVLVADEDAAVRQYLADVDGRAGGGGGDEVRTTTTTTHHHQLLAVAAGPRNTRQP